MKLTRDQIKVEIDKRLEALTQERGRGFADRIESILYANLERGRIEAYTNGEPEALSEYIELVTQGYENLGSYLHALQVEKSSKTWEPLFIRMQGWAFSFLVRKGFEGNKATQEIAVECASEAGAAMLKAHFPYDTDFDPWAHVIVQNACKKFMRSGTRKSLIPEERLQSLDENLRDPQDPPMAAASAPTNLEAELMEAIAQLSEARQRVIQLVYFEGLSPRQAAEQMGRTPAAIYGLQFNALEDLRKILGLIRNNLNDD